MRHSRITDCYITNYARRNDGRNCFSNGRLVQLVAEVEVVNKCTNEACAENKNCNKNLDNQVSVRLLCKQIVNAVDTPAKENQTN